jgi:hypothetical protein
MSDTTSKYLGKEEPEQPECSVDFSRSKGGRTKHQHSYSLRRKNRKRRSLIRTSTKPVGKEECQTKEAFRCTKGEGGV